ncbi:MAG: hypothetical protein MK102_18635 [Fuerstiella sp.]|nr:hypothetical protein [Fuerstiella sp.]
MINRVHGPGSFPDNARRAKSDGNLPVELQELVEQLAVTTVAPQASDSDWPVSIFVPERYEENYAYPLLIWFHDTGSHEGQLESVIAAISSQNYCGLGIQGNQTLAEDQAWGWNSDLLEYGEVPLRDLLSVTVRRMRQAFHIHSERIFLAGCGAGADVALQQLVNCPEWYAGAVLLDPLCDTATQSSLMAAQLTDCPLLWTVSGTASREILAQNVEAVQLARAAGASPDVRVTDSEMNPEGSDVRFIDHWLLSHLGERAWI